MLKSILLATVLLSLSVGNAFAESSTFENDPNLEITSISVTEFDEVAPPATIPPIANPVDAVIATVDGLIATGTKIWKIIDGGRPVITIKNAPTISVLPELKSENTSLNQMANWSVPSVHSYRVSFKNGYNNEVVGFTYSVFFQFNGNYKGTGKYITNLRIQTSEISSAWGFSFDATSELVGIANVGSMDEPIASATIQLSYAVKGLLNEKRAVRSFYIDGNGNIQIIQ
ncbi:MAG: hypothetical protein Q7U04_16355 [Bacteriovorax sp.]|nr:hypothetical protein [Bacteriovorax sp.]